MLLFVPAVMVLAQSAPKKTTAVDPKQAIEDEVRAVESKRVAFLTTGRIDSVAAILSDDLTHTHAGGATQTKEELLAPLRSGEVGYQSMKHEDVQVRSYGDAVMMRGYTNVNVTAKGVPAAIRIRFTTIYAKEKGQWKMVVWQSTRADAVK